MKATVASLHNVLGAEQQCVRLSRNRDEHGSPRRTVFVLLDFGAEKRNRPGRDILAKGGAAIESLDPTVLDGQVNNVWIRGIDNHVAALAWPCGKPVGRPNSPPGAATVDRNTAAVLLRSINRIGKLIIGRDVIKLRRRLVVPRAPCLSPIQADGRPLVGSE